MGCLGLGCPHRQWGLATDAFFDVDALSDHRCEAVLAEEFVGGLAHVAAYGLPRAVARDETADVVVETGLFKDVLQRLSQHAHAVDGKEPNGDGNDDDVAGQKGIERELRQSGRTIDDDVVEVAPDSLDFGCQSQIRQGVALFEFSFGQRQLQVCRNEAQRTQLRPRQGDGQCVHRCRSVDEQVVSGTGQGLGVDAKPHSTMTLRIEIDEQYPPPARGEARSQIDAGDCFSYPAFLIGNGDDPGAHAPTVSTFEKILLCLNSGLEKSVCVRGLDLFALRRRCLSRCVPDDFPQRRPFFPTTRPQISAVTIADEGAPG